MTVGFAPLFVYEIIRWFCFVTRFQWWSFFSVTSFQRRSALLGHATSMMVGFIWLWDLDGLFCSFVPLRDFKDSWFCFVMKFQWWSVLFGYEISIKVVFFFYIVPLRDFKDGWFFFLLRDLNDSRLCSVTGTWSVLFGYEISMTVGFVTLFLYEISKMVSFVLYKISKTVGLIMRFQWRSVLFCYESLMMVEIYEKKYKISMMVSFVRLWDLNDGRFCSFIPLEISKMVGWVMRFQWRSLLLREFSDGWFYFFTRSLWQ